MAAEVATHSGIGKKKRAWGTIVIAGVISTSLIYLTYTLNDPDFSWWSWGF